MLPQRGAQRDIHGSWHTSYYMGHTQTHTQCIARLLQSLTHVGWLGDIVIIKAWVMCPTTTASPPTTSHHTMTKKPQQLSPEEAKRRQLFYQKMAYIEMKKLRPKHPHVWLLIYYATCMTSATWLAYMALAHCLKTTMAQIVQSTSVSTTSSPH